MIEGWTTADYAFAISIASLLIALLSFAWNVWAKFIFPRPRVRVKIGSSMAIGGHWNVVTHLSVENHGPGQLRISKIFAKLQGRGPNGDKQIAIPLIYSGWPNDEISKELATEIQEPIPEQGSVTRHLVKVPEMKDLIRLGIKDGYGRSHYVSRRKMRQFRKSAVPK